MDMEWNQALTFSEMVKDPLFLTGEIIQIGAIKLNQTLEVVDSFNEQIAPQYYTELHPKVAEITKLSNRDLQKGKGFHTVFDSFCDWCGDDFVFLIWGTEDLRILRKNMVHRHKSRIEHLRIPLLLLSALLYRVNCLHY